MGYVCCRSAVALTADTKGCSLVAANPLNEQHTHRLEIQQEKRGNPITLRLLIPGHSPRYHVIQSEAWYFTQRLHNTGRRLHECEPWCVRRRLVSFRSEEIGCVATPSAMLVSPFFSGNPFNRTSPALPNTVCDEHFDLRAMMMRLEYYGYLFDVTASSKHDRPRLARRVSFSMLYTFVRIFVPTLPSD